MPDYYWHQYEQTLATIRREKPSTMAALKEILDGFQPPSLGVAFFPGGADDTLADALEDAGWSIDFIESDYVWNAKTPITRDIIHFVEGDIYIGPWAPSTEGATP